MGGRVGTSPQGLQTTRLQHAPGSRSSSNLVALDLPTSSATGSAQSSPFPFPRRYPGSAPRPPAPRLVSRCEEGTLRSSFHLPRNAPSTLNSHPSPSSFREHLTPLHSTDPHHGSVSRPIIFPQETSPSHRLHLQGALFRTPHSSSNSHAISTRQPFAEL